MKRKLSLVSIVVVLILLALAASPVLGGNGNDVEKAKRAQEKVNKKVLSNKDVVGTAVGLNADGEAVVRVFTAKSGVGGIPKEQDGVKIVAQVTGPINSLGLASVPVMAPSVQTTTDRWPRPVPIGVSTGHPAITAGTIGARVTDGTNVYALSNNHVYADENVANIGDGVIQPGAYDGGEDPADRIGTLSAFETIVFSASASNTIDAAIALSSGSSLGKGTPSGAYGTPSSTIVAASLGQTVQKYGRTTELTKGKITGINATLNIGYGTGTARFVDQIIVEAKKPFIKGGDSGSLLVIQGGPHDRKPVGLLYAGSGNGKMAVANRIDLVLTRFGVTIDGEGDSEPPPPTPTPTPTPIPDPSNSDSMYVWSIDMFHRTNGRGELISTVTIREDSNTDGVADVSDNPLSGATVRATLSREGNSWKFSGSTDENGQVTFKLKFPRAGITYTLCVTSVSHSHTYDASLYVEICDSLTT